MKRYKFTLTARKYPSLWSVHCDEIEKKFKIQAVWDQLYNYANQGLSYYVLSSQKRQQIKKHVQKHYPELVFNIVK